MRSDILLRKKSNLLPLPVGATKIHHLEKYHGIHEKRKIPSTQPVRLGLPWEGSAAWTGMNLKMEWKHLQFREMSKKTDRSSKV
jgi:hypothetical protein